MILWAGASHLVFSFLAINLSDFFCYASNFAHYISLFFLTPVIFFSPGEKLKLHIMLLPCCIYACIFQMSVPGCRWCFQVGSETLWRWSTFSWSWHLTWEEPWHSPRSLCTVAIVVLPPQKSFLEVFVKTDLEPHSGLILGFQLYSSVAFIRLGGLHPKSLLI